MSYGKATLSNWVERHGVGDAHSLVSMAFTGSVLSGCNPGGILLTLTRVWVAQVQNVLYGVDTRILCTTDELAAHLEFHLDTTEY